MEDLIRFVWRGAIGGMIVPLCWVTFYLIVSHGSPLVLILFIGSLWIAIPGAIVGAILWFLCSRYVESLGALLRITLGLAIASSMIVLLWIYQLWTYYGDAFHDDLVDFPRIILSVLSNGASIGVLAGWLCPSATVFRKEPKLTYAERVREYEAAQAEHEYWKAHSDSKKPQRM